MKAKIETLSIEESVQRAEALGLLPRIGELNIFRTLLRHPKLAKVVNDLLMMLLSDGNQLDARLRELGVAVSNNAYYVHELAPIYADQGLGAERAAALRRTGSVTKLSVPSSSSAPQRPQFEKRLR